MDSDRFAGLVWAFGHGRSRRHALRGLTGAGIAVLALGGRETSADVSPDSGCKRDGKTRMLTPVWPVVSVVLSLVIATQVSTGTAAQEATPLATSAATPTAAPLEVLFVQSFTAGQLAPGAEPGTATLTLHHPVGETVYFAERPNRVAGTVALESFLQSLAQEAADPLNAALVINRPEGDAVVIVELLEGTVDAAGTVLYDVRVLADLGAHATDMTFTAEPLPEISEAIDFGSSHLFVDSSCFFNPLDPRCRPTPRPDAP